MVLYRHVYLKIASEHTHVPWFLSGNNQDRLKHVKYLTLDVRPEGDYEVKDWWPNFTFLIELMPRHGLISFEYVEIQYTIAEQ